MTDDAKLAKIRKILAKAEDPSVTAEEAEAYNAKASELIAAYGIDRALLAASDPGTDTMDNREIPLDPPYARDKAHLLGTIAQALRCQVVERSRWDHRAGRRVLSLHLFGFRSDLDRAGLIFTSLLVQVSLGLASQPVPTWENPAAYRRAWMQGFSQTVGQRLLRAEYHARQRAENSRATADSGAPSVALVLVSRSQQVKRAMEDAYPDLGKARPRNLSSLSGHAAGADAGKQADLGQTRIGRSRALERGGAS